MKTPPPYEIFGEPIPAPEETMRVVTLPAGMDVSFVAHLYMNDWMAWHDIADRNQIVDVRKLDDSEQAVRLLIPPPRLQTGTFEST